MTTTNGQAPFLSVCMYLGETDEYKEELSWIIEEFLHQRILGMKNEQGVYITPAFPKLLYVLEEDNINKNGKYYYLTKLAAECTAKRMVPDYISEKIMKETNFLLHIDANLSLVNNENIFFAAKLADYIGSGTPIISITMLDGASANILRNINALVLTYSKSDIKNYLRKIVYDNYKFELNKETSLEYSSKEVAKKFDNMVSSELGVKNEN